MRWITIQEQSIDPLAGKWWWSEQGTARMGQTNEDLHLLLAKFAAEGEAEVTIRTNWWEMTLWLRSFRNFAPERQRLEE